MRRFSPLHNQVRVLGSSWNTETNVLDIRRFLAHNPHIGNVIVVTNAYHLPRVHLLLRRFGVRAEVAAAESILEQDATHGEKVRKYIKSIPYKQKTILEKLLRVFA